MKKIDKRWRIYYPINDTLASVVRKYRNALKNSDFETIKAHCDGFNEDEWTKYIELVQLNRQLEGEKGKEKLAKLQTNVVYTQINPFNTKKAIVVVKKSEGDAEDEDGDGQKSQYLSYQLVLVDELMGDIETDDKGKRFRPISSLKKEDWTWKIDMWGFY